MRLFDENVLANMVLIQNYSLFNMFWAHWIKILKTAFLKLSIFTVLGTEGHTSRVSTPIPYMHLLNGCITESFLFADLVDHGYSNVEIDG